MAVSFLCPKMSIDSHSNIINIALSLMYDVSERKEWRYG
nr:MAG TPA: hypothetical protein [Caudoviricetes sp.]